MFRLLHLLPKNLVSHTIGQVVHSRLPFGIHRTVRDWFIRNYKIDCSEAEKPVAAYETLGDFFVRQLKPGARPIESATMVSPVDGTLTQMGRFQGGPAGGGAAKLTQIKGLDYSLEELAGPGWELNEYRDRGGYMTIYLAPYNYHRIHSPIQGHITQVTYIPGALWPVNTWSVSHIPGLFVVNERIAVEIASPAGKVLLVMVGATNVGRITLDFYDGIAGNQRPRSRERVWRPSQPLPVEKGQGIGCFELGSTVILALTPGLMDQVDPALAGSLPSVVRMGQGLAP